MRAAVAERPAEPASYYARSMGGRLEIHVDPGPAGDRAVAEAHAARVARRVDRWAARLSRHAEDSELSALNAESHEGVAVGPTLGAALEAGRRAIRESEGLADVTLLDARLAAEGPAAGRLAADAAVSHARTLDWSIERNSRGRSIVRRSPGLRFDLGGVAKGWIADRALRLLDCWPGAVVDADGDMAIRCAPGAFWEVAVDDPRRPDASLALLRLRASHGVPAHWGVATSGTSIHRWNVAGRPSHHLIDPRTGQPAVTDVVQATVVAETAFRAEVLAKAAVIAGSGAGFALLDRARPFGAVLLTERGEVLALPQTLELMEA